MAESSVRELLELAHAAVDAGDVGRSRALLAAIATRPDPAPRDVAELGAVCEAAGNLSARLADFALAETLLGRALVLLESVTALGEPHLVATLTSLAAVYLYGPSPTPERAAPLLQRALGIATTCWGRDSADVVALLPHLAQVQLLRGEPAQARPLFRAAAAGAERVYGARSPQRAMALNGVAATHLAENDPGAALPLLEEAVELLGGAQAPQAALVVSNLALAYERSGQRGRAEELRRRR